MLDKLGKADIGEASKAMGLVFVIGLILAVIGGTLATMVANDTTEYANIDDALDATKMIGEFHTLGKGFVSLLAFWFPIIGVIMIAVGLGVLSMRRTVLYTVLLSVLLVVLLVLLRDVIPLHVMVSLYGIVLSLDVMSTVTSKRFPRHECNVVFSILYKRVGMKKTWIAYITAYVVMISAGFAFFEVHLTLGILVSVHAVAAAGNILSEISCKTQHIKH